MNPPDNIAGISESVPDPPLSRNILVQLAVNSLTVAENLRDNYFRNTQKFVSHLRQRISGGSAGGCNPIMTVEKIDDLRWEDIRGERVSFIDGGVGHVELAKQIPIVLRVGSYTVRPSEPRLAERENFAHYPVLLGEPQGSFARVKIGCVPEFARLVGEGVGNWRRAMSERNNGDAAA